MVQIYLFLILFTTMLLTSFLNLKRDLKKWIDIPFFSRHLSASFPFEKFEIILEYGGSQGSSKVSSILPKSDRVPPLHFLKVELEDPSVAKALCDGVDMPNTDEPSMASLCLLLDVYQFEKYQIVLCFLPRNAQHKFL